MIQFTAAFPGMKQTFVSPGELRNTKSTQWISSNVIKCIFSFTPYLVVIQMLPILPIAYIMFFFFDKSIMH
jgi:hypothetical protein